MKKTSFFLLLIIVSLNTMAHNPQVSNISITKDAATKKYSLLINVPLLICEDELRNSYPSIQIDSLSKNQFQELLLNHFKKNIQFIANNNDTLLLSKGMLSIGHETQLIFELSGLPQAVHSLHLKYAALSSQYDHFAVLQIYLADKTTGKFVFNNDNKYELSLINKNNKLLLDENQSASSLPVYLIPGIAGVILTIAGFIFFNRNKIVFNPSFILKQPVWKQKVY